MELKEEIQRRTRDASRRIEIETQKLAVGEMVLERLEEIIDLLRSAGFKVERPRKVVMPNANRESRPPVQPDIAPPPPPVAQVKNPCALCGREAFGTEDTPSGKKFLCKPHFEQRHREKAEEAETVKLMGSSGTMFQRPAPPQAVNKTIINHVDPLKGPTNGSPPVNSVLDE